jgi:hypothetical protein
MSCSDENINHIFPLDNKKTISGTDGDLYFMATDDLFPMNTPYLDKSYKLNTKVKSIDVDTDTNIPAENATKLNNIMPLGEIKELLQARTQVENAEYEKDVSQKNLATLELAHKKLDELSHDGFGSSHDDLAITEVEAEVDVGVGDGDENGDEDTLIVNSNNETDIKYNMLSNKIGSKLDIPSATDYEFIAKTPRHSFDTHNDFYKIKCPVPVCPKPMCPPPVCPTPVCPTPVCPKISYNWFQQNFMLIIFLLVTIIAFVWGCAIMSKMSTLPTIPTPV